jgi:hypothetical protein
MVASRRATALWAIPILIVVCVLAFPASAEYSGGTGEPNDPYQIATADDLIALGNEPNDYDKCFILTADIDLDPNLPGGRVFDRAVIAPDVNDADDWFEGPSFTGVFDGAGHTISHLTIAGGDFLGLFGQVVGYWPPLSTTVKNLAVVDVRISGAGDYVGGLVGHNYGATVTQCYSSGVVSGNSYVGGLVGMETMSSRKTIMDCYSTAAVSATTAYAGGLVGYRSGLGARRCWRIGGRRRILQICDGLFLGHRDLRAGHELRRRGQDDDGDVRREHVRSVGRVRVGLDHR